MTPNDSPEREAETVEEYFDFNSNLKD